MDIKQLIYLCNLEKARHFGRAAEASFVSQPTLSMRLKNLERELGLSLINRGNNFDGFTAEGERVLAWAREMVAVYQGLKLEVDALKRGTSGLLRIGAVPQCGIAVPQMLAAVRHIYPELAFQVSLFSADRLLEALQAHNVDAGIGFFKSAMLEEPRFQVISLGTPHMALLFNPQHFPSLLGDKPLSLAEVAELPLCLTDTERYLRGYLDLLWQDAEVTPKVVVESDSVLQLIQSVFVGLGCGIVPQGSLLPEMTPGLAWRSLTIPLMPRTTAVVVAGQGKATALAQHFFNVATAWLARQNAGGNDEATNDE
ncbi:MULTISPECIES: LysR family transcriptional regulator [Lonsdalea]|uniref:LysR family transcriptional regulator n=4 Tax=Lonsdalea TaxID=1082702 RepID=A0ACD1JG68_9GAMM|nr:MULTISPECIES: LysR family transcriptional regulator [Lonsdalea]RAT16232.1 LysR family transcriptional regulator [Lonsdalea quercina]RAT18297.1 LysR family transcriptional regulator [Lonsdalea quercina]RAT23926.1 LysR family transcriptional regulator [Lonsdalea populi]RAT25473.1 LysR family transcriptional regulator [Lonsdalea populi]RAT28551.1 LysR family transcriptional regulator [Lonsdalea populi]